MLKDECMAHQLRQTICPAFMPMEKVTHGIIAGLETIDVNNIKIGDQYAIDV